MRHFISFQKRKGIFITKGLASNENLVHQFNHELMGFGYVLSKDVFNTLSTKTSDELQVIYNDVIGGIKRVTGDGGYEPIYRNFPQSVIAMSYSEFAINAILHYWTLGRWRPADEGYLKREFKIEPVNFKTIKLLTNNEFDSIFTDLLYGNSSITKFDKEIVDWFLNEGSFFEFSKIGFKETAAYIGKKLLNSTNLKSLPTNDATNVLRIWAAYSDGDEGLKTNTKFKNPNSYQRYILMNTLNSAYNLEESFKIYREKWLRILFYLNPMTVNNIKLYPEVAKFSDLLRNSPKKLKTFNSKVEVLLLEKDITVLDLLKTRMGVFTRRLDHTVRLFGLESVNKWLDGNPNVMQIITAYNHFSDRDKAKAGRGAVLASQDKSEVVTYDALEPLDVKLVNSIKELIINRINSLPKGPLGETKVYIDKTLYYRPLGVNNRAGSLSLDGKVVGTVENIPQSKCIRMYVHWTNTHDIDLSGMLISKTNEVTKVGWDGSHQYQGAVTYSGDNTGYGPKNAEYLDIIPKLLGDIEWVIVDARIYRSNSGGKSFKNMKSEVRAGWMLRENPEENEHWLPQTLEHSIVLESDSGVAYLLALHLPTNSLVYLDLAMGNSIVQTTEDAVKMRIYLDKFVGSVSDEISWDKINQGHVINLLGGEVVETPEEADMVFTENTTLEEVTKYLV